MLLIADSEHVYAEIGEQNTSSPSPPPLPPPVITESASGRTSAAAELAYLYGRKDTCEPLPLEGYYIQCPNE